jgi:hypothetical protein
MAGLGGILPLFICPVLEEADAQVLEEAEQAYFAVLTRITA